MKDLHSDIVGLYGATSGTKLYDPWGEPKASTGATTELGFQSDYTDPDSGQVDMGTRYYEPTMGRFSTQDVLFGETANPNTLNQYVYGADSPVTMWDPTGMNSSGNTSHIPACAPQCADKDNPAGDIENHNGGGNVNTEEEGATGESNATGEIEPDIVERDIEAEDAYRAYQALAQNPSGYNGVEARQIVSDFQSFFGGCKEGESDCYVVVERREGGNASQGGATLTFENGKAVLVHRADATWVAFSFDAKLGGVGANTVDGVWGDPHVATSKGIDRGFGNPCKYLVDGCLSSQPEAYVYKSYYYAQRVPRSMGEVVDVTVTINTVNKDSGGRIQGAISSYRRPRGIGRSRFRMAESTARMNAGLSRLLLASALAVLLPSCARQSDEPAVEVSDGLPAASPESQGVPASALRALATYADVSAHDVKILAFEQRESKAWVLATLPSHAVRIGDFGHRVGAFGLLQKQEGEWSAQRVTFPPGWRDPPLESGNGFVLEGATHLVGIGGFVDPDLTSFSLVSTTGAVVAEGSMEGGAFLAVAEPGDQIRLFDDRGLVLARPVVLLSDPPTPPGDTDEAEAAARSFLEHVLGNDSEAAEGLVAEAVDPSHLIPGLEGVISGLEADSSFRFTGDGYEVEIGGGPRAYRLALLLTTHGGEPRIIGYNFHTVEGAG